MSDHITIDLDFPITTPGGDHITTLTIRRAKAKDIRKMKGDTEVEQSMSLLSMLTGLVPEDLDELDIVDFQKASKVLEQMATGKSA